MLTSVKRLCLLLIVALLLSQCNNGQKESSQPVKNDSLKSKTELTPQSGTSAKDNEPQPLEINLGEIASLRGCCFSSFTLAEFLQNGAGVYLDSRTTCFDVSQLIGHAKDPAQVQIRAKGFHEFCLLDFVEKGAKVILDCDNFSSFEIRSLINHATDKSKITVIACNCYCGDVLDFIKMGAKIKINKKHDPFQIITYTDAGKDRVMVYGQGYSSNWVINFIERGATLYVDYTFPEYHIYEFVREGKDRVIVCAKYLSIRTLERILIEGGKIVIGKFPMNCPKGPNFSAFDIMNLIAINPKNVTVVADGYEAHEIAKFIQLGATIVFNDCTHKTCDINTFINKTPPPSYPALSEPNKPFKQRTNAPCPAVKKK